MKYADRTEDILRQAEAVVKNQKIGIPNTVDSCPGLPPKCTKGDGRGIHLLVKKCNKILYKIHSGIEREMGIVRPLLHPDDGERDLD